jgi:hypothetical protein
VKGSLADLDVLSQRVADAREDFGSNQSLAFHQRIIVPNLEQMLLDDYRANAGRSLKRIKAALGHLRAFFRDYLSLDITSDRVSSYVACQEEKAAAATINRELAALKRAFRIAEKAGKVIARPDVSMASRR